MSQHAYPPTHQMSFAEYQRYQQQQQQQNSKPARHRAGATKSRDWESDTGAQAGPSNSKEKTIDASAVSPAVASSVIRRFLATRLSEEGFERAESAALLRLEVEVVACTSRTYPFSDLNDIMLISRSNHLTLLSIVIEQIFSRAKAFADIAARGRPNAHDALAAAYEYDLDVPALMEESTESARKRSRKRKQSGMWPRTLQACSKRKN